MLAVFCRGEIRTCVYSFLWIDLSFRIHSPTYPLLYTHAHTHTHIHTHVHAHTHTHSHTISRAHTQPLPIFLQGLEVSVQRETLQSGVRQYLHRMIICLGDELLKYVPMAVSLLLKDCKVCVVRQWGVYVCFTLVESLPAFGKGHPGFKKINN